MDISHAHLLTILQVGVQGSSPELLSLDREINILQSFRFSKHFVSRTSFRDELLLSGGYRCCLATLVLVFSFPSSLTSPQPSALTLLVSSWHGQTTGSGVAEWARALTGDRTVNGSSPAAVKTFRFASELWQFRLPRLASVFRMRH